VSYRNAIYNGREGTVTLFTWDEDGNRIRFETSVDPYLYLEGNGNYESIFGTKLIKKKFNSQYNRYKFVKDSGIKRVFENLPQPQQFLVDTYWKQNEEPGFNNHPIKTMFIDIETYSPDDFPNIQTANHLVNVITIYDSLNDNFITWGIKGYKNTQDDVTYVECADEKDLFKNFIKHLEKDYPDILSGWNSEFFDIPYIINRCQRILGDEWVARLSPTGNVTSRTIRGAFGREQVKWYIEGISLIDYLDVYKKFTQGLRESYKLDAIGEIELGQKKVEYGNMNLATLSDDDWQTFVDYNIQDVRLLKHLEEKLKYLDLLRMLAYTGLTTFEAAMGALSVINGATAIRGRRRGQVIHTFIRNEDTGKNPGAYVGEPLRGFQENIISFDANSLYPNVMISLNMSPETKIGKIEDKNDKEVTIRHANGKLFTLTLPNFAKFVRDEQIAVSKANVLFTQKKKGVMPEILDEYYNKRVEVKKELGRLRRQYSKEKDPAVKVKIDQLDSKQLCIKIFINSIYGYFGNKNAPFGDDDIASSITLTGQAVIKESNELLKKYIKQKTGIDDEQTLNSTVVYNDTDSSYISVKPLVDKGLSFTDEGGKLTTEFHDEVQNIEDFLNDEIKIWGKKSLNSQDCRFVFKREVIADVGVFLQKKRYVLHILDDEGIPMDKYKYTGVEVVRSTMPAAIKPYVKKIIETMLSTQDITQTNNILNETYKIFKDLPIEDIAFVSGIKGYEKYATDCDGFKTTKGMPNHVKAAYYHNLLLKKFNIDKEYEEIGSGDKVRYFYVQKPNPYNLSNIAYKYYYPEEFKKAFNLDYEIMFEKIVFNAIERFYENVKWAVQKPGSLTQTNLFDLLS
jgi:DNA polymerase elongation subunit (family B)